MPLCAPQLLHRLAWIWARASTLRGWRLTETAGKEISFLFRLSRYRNRARRAEIYTASILRILVLWDIVLLIAVNAPDHNYQKKELSDSKTQCSRALGGSDVICTDRTFGETWWGFQGDVRKYYWAMSVDTIGRCLQILLGDICK